MFLLTLKGSLVLDVANREPEQLDHGSIVGDEIVPFWLVLAYCPASLSWQGGAFLLFRLFDITKPQPARFFDRQVKNGFGVMADDLVAAGYSIGALAALQYLLK